MEHALASAGSCHGTPGYRKSLLSFEQLTAPGHRRLAVPEEVRPKNGIFVIDQDPSTRLAVEDVFEASGFAALFFATCPDFFSSGHTRGQGCILIDAGLFLSAGAGLRDGLKDCAHEFVIIVMAVHPTLGLAVQSMRAGASDFIGKPFVQHELIASIKRVAKPENDAVERSQFRDLAVGRVATLTARQHQIMDLVVAGHPSKNIAADLNISQRTVENHRASIARKTGSKSLANVVQTALCATCVFRHQASESLPIVIQ